MSLLKLFKQGSVSREKVHGLYLYCSPDKTIGEQQIKRREAQSAQQGTRAIISGTTHSCLGKMHDLKM